MIFIYSAYRKQENQRENKIYAFCHDVFICIDEIEYNMNEIYIILEEVDYVKNSILYNIDLKKLTALVDETLRSFQYLEHKYGEGFDNANARIDKYIKNTTDYDSYEEYYNYLAPIYSEVENSEYIAEQMLDLVAYETNDTYLEAHPDVKKDFLDSIIESVAERYADNPEELEEFEEFLDYLYK